MLFEKAVVKMYRGMAYTRRDDDDTAYYSSAEDFHGLMREAFPFRSSRGYDLQGYLYRYENPISGRIIVRFPGGSSSSTTDSAADIGRI